MKILKIENKTGKVTLDDTVDEFSRKQLAREMSKVFGAEAFTNPDFTNLTNEASNQIDRLEITINSPGGSVFEGMVIVNELKAMSAKGVHTVAIVNVLAASMGSVISAACDECMIVPNGQMMIHEVSIGIEGTAKDLHRMADLCDGLSNEIAGIYAEKTGRPMAEMRELMMDETWMNAAKCVELGFADSLFDIRAEHGKTVSNMSLLARLTNPSADEAVGRISALENQISSLEADHATAFADFKSKIEIAETALQEAAGFKNEIETLTGKLTESDRLANENAQAISELTDKLSKAESSAAGKAVEIAAAAGITAPLEIENLGSTPVDHLLEVGKLTGSARTEYISKHGKEIREQMKK